MIIDMGKNAVKDLSQADPSFTCIMRPPRRKRLKSVVVSIPVEFWIIEFYSKPKRKKAKK
jgi:hypothetical protein